MKIFLTDDSEVYCVLFDHVLKNKFTDYQLKIFSDGKSCLDALKNEEPDMIFLDYQLQSENGQDLLGIIKRDMPSLPVIMVTSQIDDGVKKELLDAGADDYIDKGKRTFELILDRLYQEHRAANSFGFMNFFY